MMKLLSLCILVALASACVTGKRTRFHHISFPASDESAVYARNWMGEYTGIGDVYYHKSIPDLGRKEGWYREQRVYLLFEPIRLKPGYVYIRGGGTNVAFIIQELKVEDPESLSGKVKTPTSLVEYTFIRKGEKIVGHAKKFDTGASG